MPLTVVMMPLPAFTEVRPIAEVRDELEIIVTVRKPLLTVFETNHYNLPPS